MLHSVSLKHSLPPGVRKIISTNVEISTNQTISKVQAYELCITVDATEVRIAADGGHKIA
jgi:hypothetical protein